MPFAPHPYSVVLLDEIEKAHEDIYNICCRLWITRRSPTIAAEADSATQSSSDVERRLARDERRLDRIADVVRRARRNRPSSGCSAGVPNRLDAIVTFKALSSEAWKRSSRSSSCSREPAEGSQVATR